MAKVLDYDFVINEFELQSRFYVHLRTNTVVYIYILHTYRRNDNRRSNKRRKKTSLQIYLPFTLLQGFERVVQGLYVRGCWRTNVNFIFWPPLLMTVTLCLSCSLRCSTRGLGVHCWMLAFFTASYQHLLWTPVHQGFKPPSAWCGFPYHISSLTLWKSAGDCFGTQLNSII